MWIYIAEYVVWVCIYPLFFDWNSLWLVFPTCPWKHISDHNLLYTYLSSFCLILQLIDAGMFLEFEHFDYIIKFLHQLQVSSQEVNTVLNIKSRSVFKELFCNYICLDPSSGSIFLNLCKNFKRHLENTNLVFWMKILSYHA